MSTQTCRAVRLVQMMRLLQENTYSTRKLAERLNVSIRTVQRDLLDLQSEPLYVPLENRGTEAQPEYATMQGWRP